mmetsp:Transcript_12136/g.22061  ORF Transcript_12136/g.22061 Transcript_12136/m.22061 type:complete len:211 (+) Transcript_12136:620-1252(+)
MGFGVITDVVPVSPKPSRPELAPQERTSPDSFTKMVRSFPAQAWRTRSFTLLPELQSGGAPIGSMDDSLSLDELLLPLVAADCEQTGISTSRGIHSTSSWECDFSRVARLALRDKCVRRVLSKPITPPSFLPQAYTRPEEATATACDGPTLIVDIFVSTRLPADGNTIGFSLFVITTPCPCPSRPMSLFPKLNTFPVEVTTNVVVGPRAT